MKKKKLIVIILVIILGISIGTTTYLLLPKKNNLKEPVLNINNTIVINSLNVEVGNDFYIIKRVHFIFT